MPKNTKALTAGKISEVTDLHQILHQQYLYQKVWLDLEMGAMNSVSVLSYYRDEIGEKNNNNKLCSKTQFKSMESGL